FLPRPSRLLGSVPNDRLQTEGSLDLRLITADLLAMPSKHLVLVPEDLRRAACIPHIGVPGDRSQGLSLARPPDHDRHVRLNWPRQRDQIVEGVAPARRRRDATTIEQGPNRGD